MQFHVIRHNIKGTRQGCLRIKVPSHSPGLLQIRRCWPDGGSNCRHRLPCQRSYILNHTSYKTGSLPEFPSAHQCSTISTIKWSNPLIYNKITHPYIYIPALRKPLKPKDKQGSSNLEQRVRIRLQQKLHEW